MNYCSFFLLFSSVFLFLNVNVEATTGLPPPLGDVTNVVIDNVDSIKIPIKYPLPALGTTACSTYPHANLSIDHFKKLCYTQLSQRPDVDFQWKCMTSQFTVGIPLADVPFKLPTPVDFIPQAGYYLVAFTNMQNTSQHFFYNKTFVQAQEADMILYVMNGANLTLVQDSVITHYTDKGYVSITCPIIDLSKPLCASPNYITLCTYEKFPPPSDVKALLDPLNAYPYYFGKSLLAMDQTGC